MITIINLPALINQDHHHHHHQQQQQIEQNF